MWFHTAIILLYIVYIVYIFEILSLFHVYSRDSFIKGCGLASMPIDAKCCCSYHNQWYHGAVQLQDLRSATRGEALFCSSDQGHPKRKRKVCLACLDRIKVDLKVKELVSESELTASGEGEVRDAEPPHEIEVCNEVSKLYRIP